MLRRLQTHDVGPAKDMTLEFGERLNVLTGDNGLGKSFVLELVWWLLTGSWAGPLAVPSGQAPKVWYQAGDPADERGRAHFEFADQAWRWDGVHKRAPRGSVIYVGAQRQASFVHGRSVFPPSFPDVEHRATEPDAFRFQGSELWEGKVDGSGRPVCNGLIRDVVNWMRSRPVAGFGSPSAPPAPDPFAAFERVLEVLSPPGGKPLTMAAPRRVFVGDSREIPTLHTPWEREPVPVTLAAAGMRRVLELAYLLVWTWHEHLQVSQLKRLVPQQELFILVDEPELHLHPRWQRTVLPAIVAVANELDPSLRVQLFVTTHSPLVLASGELLVDPQRDRLFHFDARGGDVVVDEHAWVKQGDAVGWLTSELFGFDRGGSLESEQAIRWADAFMEGRVDEIPERFRDKRTLDEELRRVLAASDTFWARWFVSSEDVAS
ncbi:hypothetical protein DB30_03250 [Enhygromyxa salina]|uniref:ATPase AAA-type core domain-containing protein n=1 Tax=Enhygromyxa salina TaxID=215803 RepID=A0A0C1ZJ63_9BACT|nr:ATP-binding protein [Enhygromyxa salina]KIG17549.1 hypothetical protein DB30_03250 [Enhygromyxa salina]